MNEQKEYLRFSAAQRIEHWVQMLSFTGLALTGLPQKFAGDGWAETMIGVMGGIESVRIIHHVSAIVLSLACLYHVIAVAYKVFVLRVRWTMFPRLDDLLDALDVVRHNIGLTKERPKLDRFSFEEKAEYWAFVWGAILMGVTGFLMWNPINAIRFIPGDLIPAAKAAHGGEALLAVLAIIVWHFYGVHIKTFSKAMFTGKLSRHQMEEEHGLELERVTAGRADARPSPEVIKQRERLFIPLASVLSIGALVVLYFFVNYEQTAITTLPKRAQVQIYAPITPTPTPRAGAPTVAITAKVLPASHEGRATCNVCHANNIGPKLPVDHAGRTDATCTACHKMGAATPAAGATPAATLAPTSGTGIAKSLPASHEGRTTCLACHQTLPQPKLPDDHAGRIDATCTVCHKPGAPAAPATQVPGTSAPATAAPTTGSATTTGPKPQPASHAGRTVCLACHQTLTQPAFPADHAGRADAACAACHKAP